LLAPQKIKIYVLQESLFRLMAVSNQGDGMREIKIVLPELEDVVPEEFLEHMLKATKEILLAMRTLIDSGLDKIEAVEEITKAKKEIKKIEVE